MPALYEISFGARKVQSRWTGCQRHQLPGDDVAEAVAPRRTRAYSRRPQIARTAVQPQRARAAPPLQQQPKKLSARGPRQRCRALQEAAAISAQARRLRWHMEIEEDKIQAPPASPTQEPEDAHKAMMRDTDKMLRATKKGDCDGSVSIIQEKCGNSETERTLFVNRRDKMGSTVLMDPVWHGNLPMVRMLLSMRADPSCQNTKRDTPLHLACQRGHMAMIRLLITAGASTNVRNAAGKRCWELAQDELKDKVRHLPGQIQNAKE
jgi:hypothetical protein